MNKQELRIKIRNELKKISPERKKIIEARLYSCLFNTSQWQYAKTIGITLSKSFEWNTKPIIEQAWKQHKEIVVPKVNQKNKSLSFFKINSFHDVQTGSLHILEPKSTIKERIEKTRIDLLIIPGIVFDRSGYRIGFGGGYFDRFLIDFPNETVSLVDCIQLVDSIPKDVYDIPVKALVTTDKVIQSEVNHYEDG